MELSPSEKLVLREAAIRAKLDLSSTHAAQIHLPGFLRASGKCFDLDVGLGRDAFEAMSRPLLARAEGVLRRAVAALGPGEKVTDVILTGGSSRIPCVQALVASVTGLAPCRSLDCEIGVAEGASLHAGVLKGEVREVLLLDVVPTSYSIGMKGDVAARLIERNTTIPTRKSEVVTTASPSQAEITVQVYEGESAQVSKNTCVGSVRLDGVPPAPAGVPQNEVTFDIDTVGTFHVSAKDLGTGKEVRTKMESPYRLNPAQIKVLQRKVEVVFEEVRREERLRRERQEQEAGRALARRWADRLQAFLRGQGVALSPAQGALLEAGRQLIEDYVSRGVAHEDLERLLSSVTSPYPDTILALLLQAAQTIADSPEMTELETRFAGPSAERKPEDFLRELTQLRPIEVPSIADLLSRVETEFRASLLKRYFEKEGAAGPASLYLAMVATGRSAGYQPRFRNLTALSERERHLLTIYLLNELNASNWHERRLAAVQVLVEACKGTECFFLVHKRASEADPKIKSCLEDCIRAIPSGCWTKRILLADAAERRALTSDPLARKLSRKDLIATPRQPGAALQRAAFRSVSLICSSCWELTWMRL